MGKILGSIILILIGIAVFKPSILQNWKNKTLEFINPAFKERRLLGDLDSQIRELGGLINDNGKKLSPDNLKRINSILENSQSTISEVERLNEKGDFSATINNLLQKVLPGNDNKLKSEPTWIPPSLISSENCKVKNVD